MCKACSAHAAVVVNRPINKAGASWWCTTLSCGSREVVGTQNRSLFASDSERGGKRVRREAKCGAVGSHEPDTASRLRSALTASRSARISCCSRRYVACRRGSACGTSSSTGIPLTCASAARTWFSTTSRFACIVMSPSGQTGGICGQGEVKRKYARLVVSTRSDNLCFY